MKPPMSLRHLALLITPLLVAACSGSSSASPVSPTSEVVASGALTLSGPDAATLGGMLAIGDVARVNGPGTVRTYYCLNTNSSVSGFEYGFDQTPGGVFDNTTLGDPINSFVINVIDDVTTNGLNGVSMTIFVQGVSYDYTCTFCPGLSFDDGQQTITFDDVEADPAGGAETGVLTLDGTISWGLPQ